MFIIGTKETLQSILSNYCIKDYDNIYTSFDAGDCDKSVDYKVEPKPGTPFAQEWQVGSDNKQNISEMGSLWVENNLHNAKCTFTFTCDDLYVPPYYSNPVENIKITSSPNVIAAYNVTYPHFAAEITTIEYNKIPLDKEVTMEVSYVVNKWVEAASTLDDINEPNMEGKTWGLKVIVDNIDKAFYPGGRNADKIVGSFKYKFQKLD